MNRLGSGEHDSSVFQGSSESTLRQSTQGQSTQSLSSLSRLFSRRSKLDSRTHKSQRPGKFTKVVVDETSEPLHVLSGLMRTLRESNVPGPRLLRLKSEFAHLIGKGAQFEVFGLDEHLSASLKQEKGRASEILAQSLGSLAVKRSRAASTRKTVLSRDASAHLSFQLRAAHREIDALCYPPFRDHPNIVKLLGWGLCLDSLESPDEDSPRIPLLILERADCTLTEFLENIWNHRPVAYCSELQPICVDIGQGLQALHSENIAHGDLKPENILLFERNGRWTAKLCDFGLSADDLKQDDSAVVYHGTPCWRAPEVMTQDQIPLVSGSLQSCDIFAFGLVVWSAYSRIGRAPLTPGDEKRGNAYELATWSLRSNTQMQKSERERILCVIQSALRRIPLERHPRPWELFSDQLTDNKNLEAPVLIYTKQIAAWSYSTLSHVVRLFVSYMIRIWASTTSALHRGVKILYINLWRPPEPIPALPERQARYFEVYSLYAHLDRSASPTDTSPFRHFTQGCFDLHELYHSMQQAITNQDSILLYSLARIRSRLHLCCWQKVNRGREVNIINAVVRGKHEFETLAWLCRGAIGRHEIQERSRNRGLLWQCTYERPASFDFRHISRQSLNANARVDRFLLLLENGGHLEDEVAPHGGTVFLNFLKTLTEFGKAGYGDDRISLICRRFKHLAQQTQTAPQTRYYMTGELPENLDNINDFSTTALHDSVLALHYSAVEQLVRMGFVVNALNDRKMTAYQIAMRTHSQQPSIDTVRILALLKQSTKHPVHIAPLGMDPSTVPLGWEIRSFDMSDRGSPKKLEYFYESFTNSHTFERPKFSLFEDRRLALGYRKILGNGQTYYLDLVRFIDPGENESKGESASDRQLVFHDDWYRNEPARSEEERSRVEQLRHLPKYSRSLAGLWSRYGSISLFSWERKDYISVGAPRSTEDSDRLQNARSARIRSVISNILTPLVARCLSTFRRHPASERSHMQPRRGIFQYISERTRGFRLWPPTISERSYIEAFFDSVTARATEGDWRLRQERRGLQHPTRKSHAQATASRRTHARTDSRAEPALLDSGPLHLEWKWAPHYKNNNDNNNEVARVNAGGITGIAAYPASSNRWRTRVRSARSLPRNIITALSSLGSSNTAVDPDEREALLAADGITASSIGGDAYESAAIIRDEEGYLDINGQYAGVQFPGAVNV